MSDRVAVGALRRKLEGCVQPGKDGPNGTFELVGVPALTVNEILYLLTIIPSADEDPLAKLKAANARVRAAEKQVFGVPRSAEADERLRETMAEIDKLRFPGIRLPRVQP